ncbi:hypothetical protein GRI41_12005 [Altererythrobacter aquaemixtae]|uniref:Uncharacterized protein n=2 Tax=Pontixanthobacter aquaemixtae TaxID=1958940 RepID=A0A844ZWJ3_9SPHN|nr:hypothetical protein [Pontixanthobacter aquaemixtae]
MTNTAPTPPQGKSPFLYVGIMFAAIGTVIALAATDAINGPTALILMIAPLWLVIPAVKAANRRAEASCAGKGEVNRRYLRRVAMFTSFYLATLALMKFINKDFDPAIELRTFLALLPGLAIAGIFWSIGRLIVEQTDEFIRMLTIRQSLWATGFALSAASVWGFLEQADIVIHLDAYWWAVWWFFGLGVGAVINRIQYGTWGAV